MHKTIFGLIAGVILLGSASCDGHGDVTGADAGRSVDAQPVSKETGVADATDVGMVDSVGAREVGRDTAIVPSPDAAKDALFDTSAATNPDTGRADTNRDMAMDGPPFEAASDSPSERSAADGALDARGEDGLNLGDAEGAGDQLKGDAHYQLDLVFSVDGQNIPVSSSGVFGCAF